MNFWEIALFVCPMLFLAGCIDGISGGGGIIALPTYLLTGMPINAAYGCNKLQSFLGTSASLYKYARCGFVDYIPALICGVGAIVGSAISTRVMLHLDDSIKTWIIVGAMCFILTLTLLTVRMNTDGKEAKKQKCTLSSSAKCLMLGLVLGLYDGFFGPGGGTVALMLFSVLFRYDMRVATGNGKLVIVVSNLMALIGYIRGGYVMYAVAIPASIANIAGSYIGASLAVKKGKTLVRKMLLLVVAVLLVQTALKLL